MARVTLNYWAGARAAAGTERETVEAGSLAEALALVVDQHADARFARVLGASSLLLEGTVVHGEGVAQPLDEAVQVEVLPPFAGG